MRSSVTKILAGAMAIALCATMAACNNNGGGASSTKPSTSSGSAGTSSVGTGKYEAKDYSNESPLKVSFTGIAWGNGAEKDGLVEKEFEKMLNLDMDVQWIVNTDYAERVNMMMIGGTLTDVTQIMGQNGRNFYPQVVQAIKNNVFTDLTPYVLDNGFKDANEIMSTWSDAVWENCKYDGKLYLLPRKMSQMDNQGAFWYRKDILDKTDLKLPTTLDELKNFIIDLQKAAKDQGLSNMYGIAGSSEDIDGTFKQVAVAYTGVQEWAVDKDGNFQHQSFMPEYKEFLQWVKDLFDAGAIDPEYTLNQTKNSSFEEGNSVSRFGSWQNWNQSEDLTTNKWFKTAVDPAASVWAIGPIEGPKGPTITIGDGSGYAQPVMISAKFNKDNIDRLLQAICRYDEDYLWFLHYGLEGTHYTMVDGQPTQTNEEQKAEKLKGYVGGWNQILMDSNDDFVKSKFERAHSGQKMIDDAKKIHEDSLKLIDKYNLSNPVQTINSEAYNSKWANLTKDLKNNRNRVVMGEITMEQWDAYVEQTVNSADYKAIVQEFKEAYNAQK